MDEVRSKPIAQIHRLILNQEISAQSLCTHYLDRIENDTHNAMSFNLRESALSEAKRVDVAIFKGEAVGSLAGIPVAIKDNIDTRSAICTAGLPQLQNYRPGKDALFVSKLRQADAIIVGMTATDSGAFGVTTPGVRHPKHPELFVGGSSGGSGAAVAAELCKFAIGTDTGGSIRIPAACCGIAGFKPTYSKNILAGIRPLALSYDHVGPLADSVSDLHYVMKTLLSSQEQRDETQDLKNVRIGIPDSFYSDASIEVQEMMLEVKSYCRNSNLNVVSVEIPLPDEILPNHLILSLTEAAVYHLENFPNNIVSYPQIAIESIELGQSYGSCDYLQAKQRIPGIVDRFNKIFDFVDVMILPTLPIPVPGRCVESIALQDEELSVLEALIRYTAPFNQTGLPVVAFPWQSKERPFCGSLQIVGQHNSDLQLLRLAEEFSKGAKMDKLN